MDKDSLMEIANTGRQAKHRIKYDKTSIMARSNGTFFYLETVLRSALTAGAAVGF